MAFEMTESGKALTEAQLQAVESRFGLALPNSYRRFLLAHNGGRSERCVFYYKDESGPYTDSVIDWWFAINDGGNPSFEEYYQEFKIDEVRVPVSLVPIAHDPGGSLICISVGKEDNGSIYFWDAGDDSGYVPGETPTMSNCHLVADSLEEFVDSLTLE